jgi:hypothetical protein
MEEKELYDIVLNIPCIGFDDSSFVDRGMKWEAKTLYKAAEDIPEFELPLAGIDLSVMPWNIKNIFNVAEHMGRVMKADLKYPVLLDDYGYICDGWHRLVKALLLKKSHIRAKRLSTMPEPDAILEEQNQKS